MLSSLREHILNTLFPPICIACKKDLAKDTAESILCVSCMHSATMQPQLNCSVCRRRLPFGEAGILPRSLRCHPSASHLIFSACSYEHPVIRALIWHLKFKRQTEAAQILGKFLDAALRESGIDLTDTRAVPLPLSAARLRDRGFNQAELIARQLHAPIDHLLVRMKHTHPQSEIARWDQRRINIAGVFALVTHAVIDDREIVLIDDVWTSGATMSEAVAVLKEGGARDVLAIVVARAGQ